MAKQKIADSISQQVADKHGNSLWIMNSGNVYLKLLKEKKKRRLGFIDRGKKIFYIRRKRATHLFRKANAYGFNHHLISKAKSFDTISLKDEFGQYEFPVSKIIGHGRTHLQFKEKGFELQLFLPLEIIENCRHQDIIETF